MRRASFARAVWGLLLASGATLVGTGSGTVRAEGRVHEIIVENHFFAPQNLVIEVGDTVLWINLTGIHHNVVACTAEQLGCSGQGSTETFDSGPASTLWVYDYTFTTPGSNPYVCQPHATAMNGTIEVLRGPPPGVPDGAEGTPLTVDRPTADGSTLSIEFDTATCAAVQHQIVMGGGSTLPSTLGGVYGVSGAVCAIGTESPFVWSDVPDPASDPSRLLWFIVVATDAMETEGSWGRDSNGAERMGPGAGGASGACGVVAKSLDNRCGQ